MGSLASTFWKLIRVPFEHADLIWGIVPLYFGWAVNELTSPRATYGTAVQTGFAFLWAGAQWIWQALPASASPAKTATFSSVSFGVTLGVLILGGMAFWSGLRRRYPKGMSFLGHTRFAGYFMIALFPMQSGHLAWNRDRVAAILVFAVPVWLAVHLVLLPLRRRQGRAGTRRRSG